MATARITEPTEAWADEYLSISVRLMESLGDIALRVDHIGSTSVPGLAAKDVIDVQVTVATLDDPLIATTMQDLGFRSRTDGGQGVDHIPRASSSTEASDWAKLFFQEPLNQRRVNVHIRAAGKPNQRYALLFRDYLRAHPTAAGAYEDFKRRLASLDVETATYAEIKDPVCDVIMAAAENWATSSRWSMG